MHETINSNFFVQNINTKYLPEEDRYLSVNGKAKHRFNVIGAGNMGQEHMRVTMLEGRSTIHGIYDVEPLVMDRAEEMFAERFPGHPLVKYKSLSTAINDSDVDGLIICTPNHSHLAIVRESVKSGKHILLEKPMAATLEDALEIKRAAREYSGVFQIGLQYRYKPTYAEAIHEALHRGSIGSIKTISIMEHRLPFLDKIKQWNKFSKYSGGTLVEKCCHYFDLMNLFAGSMPVSVYASGGMAVNFTDFAYGGAKSDILDNASVIVTYENGVRASFDLVMFSPMFYEEMVICGDRGRLKVFENEDFLPDKRQSTHLEILCGENGVSKVSTPCYPAVIQGSGHFGATYYEHKSFVDGIENRNSSAATVDEGFWSIAVGAAAEESVKTGRVVAISEMLER